MNAVIATGGLSPESTQAFTDQQRPVPVPGTHDLLVKVAAAGMNPVDTKVFARLDNGTQRVLGWDAVGEVVAVGPEAGQFRPGQRVFYAGDLTRDGSNAEYQLVDARIAALAPSNLSDAEAAVMPLTSITAWEGVFDRLGFVAAPGANKGRSLLVIGGAGGVGSMIIQLAAWAGITVAATAGRPNSAQWCKELGASVVIGRDNIPARMQEAGLPQTDAIFCTTHASDHWAAMAEVIKPQGNVCLIDDPSGPLDITLFKPKCARICWEFMFTRSLFHTEDIDKQGQILDAVARMVEAGTLRTTLASTLAGLSADTVRQAHLRQASETMVGKQVIVF